MEVVMSVELEKARQQAAGGDDKGAVKSLWAVEALARSDPDEARGLIEVATAIRERASGRIQRDCELLLGHAQRSLEHPVSTPERQFRVGIPVSTSNDVPGYEVTDYIGEVFGLVVRSRGAFPQLGAGLKSIIGGELGTMTNLLRDTRTAAISRMVEEAGARGADALIAMRFDVQEMAGTWTEVCAYGTAVRAKKLDA